MTLAGSQSYLEVCMPGEGGRHAGRYNEKGGCREQTDRLEENMQTDEKLICRKT
jgi:hypothetical protein